MEDILSQIVLKKREEVKLQKKLTPTEQIVQSIETTIGSETKVTDSLFTALSNSKSGIIAEFKRRSPSKLWINRSADAKQITSEYQRCGATAISVLTDEHYFGGNTEDLQIAIAQTTIPILRKEFIVDEYQIFQSKMYGATSILLIASALTKEECKRFTKLSHSLNIGTLLELHDESELDYIMPEHNVIGINNRNLGTFHTNVEKSFKMIDLLPKNAILISESGISNPHTVRLLRQAGYRGFLIGENFMKTTNPGDSLYNFIKEVEL